MYLTSGKTKFEQKELHHAIAEFIVTDELPFSFCEKVGFGRLINKLVPGYTLPSRERVARDIEFVIFPTMEQAIKREFSSLVKAFISICATTDIWTCSSQTKSYMSLTIHWIDEKWVTNSLLIGFEHITGKHDAEKILGVFMGILKEYGLQESLLSVTLDNASNNAKFMKLLKSRLADRTLLDGEYLHTRCCGHIINLVVKDGLSKVKKDVTNLRALVRSLGYPQRLEKFEERVEEFLIPHDPDYAKKARPKMDVLTRWNCTLEMIESSLPYVQIFSMMENEEIDMEILDKETGEVKVNPKTNLPMTKSKKYKVSTEGWNKMKVLGEFLEPMRDATRWYAIDGTMVHVLYNFLPW